MRTEEERKRLYEEYLKNQDRIEEMEALRYVGKKIGMLQVVRAILDKSDPHYHMLECICDCGNICYKKVSQLKSTNKKGVHTNNCGCMTGKMRRDGIIKSHNSHGMYDHKLMYTYNAMKSRCYNKNNPKYHLYGGRGIVICDEWLEEGEGNPGFKNFVRWAYDRGFYDQPKGTPRSEILTIDRINNDGPYAPWNCRWVTNQVQSNNRSTNRHIMYKKKVYTYTEFCNLFDVKFIDMHYYLSRGMSLNLMVYNFIHKRNKIYYRASDNTYRDKEGFQHLLPRYDVRLID